MSADTVDPERQAQLEAEQREQMDKFNQEHKLKVIKGGPDSNDASTQHLDGAKVLDHVADFLLRFVAYPDEHGCIAHTLWIAHAHLVEIFESTPRLAFLSPEPASGKTRALEITEMLVPRPVEAINVTPAYLFRKVGDEDGKPTILYDEIDTVFGPKAKDNEEIRGLLNAGHRQGAVAGRCVTVGKTVKTEEISAYCAVALAGLGNLPDTILSRSIVVRMKRRAPHERVEAYRRRIHHPEGEQLQAVLASWCEQVSALVGQAYPEIPAGVEDRDADVWEPLLAIADAAGGDWPDKARLTALTLVTESKDTTPSLGIKLLQDVKDIFGDKPAMFTEDILGALNAMEEAPWGDLKGKPMDSRRLASFLRKYITVPEGERSKTVWVEGRSAKGYKAEWLWDAWQRYCPASLATSPSGPSEASAAAGNSGFSPDEPDAVPDTSVSGNRCNHAPGDVPDGPDGLPAAEPTPYEPGADCPKCAGEGCPWCREVTV